jgi:tetratricopeptide (TPR) repeat protein
MRVYWTLGMFIFCAVVFGQKDCSLSKDFDTAISLKNFEEASVLWKNYLAQCESKTEAEYKKGEAIYTAAIENANDPKSKKNEVDALLGYYNQYNALFPNNGMEVFSKLAFVMYSYKDDFKTEQIKKAFNLAFQEKRESFREPSYLLAYFEVQYQNFHKEENGEQKLLALYFDVAAKCTVNRLKFPEFSSEYDALLQTMQVRLKDQLNRMSLDAFAHKADEKELSNPFWIQGLVEALAKFCEMDPIFLTRAEQSYQLEKNAATAYYYAVALKNQGSLDKALAYFDESLTLEKQNTLKSARACQVAMYLIGSDNKAAMNYLQKAQTADPKNAKVSLLMGEVYVNAIKECDLEGKSAEAVYILAAKTVVKAAEADKRYAAAAQKKAEEYRKKVTTPAGKKTSVAVGCWINQTVNW